MCSLVLNLLNHSLQLLFGYYDSHCRTGDLKSLSLLVHAFVSLANFFA